MEEHAKSPSIWAWRALANTGFERAMMEDGVTEEWVITTENIGRRGVY
jgi:hypothetical protein